MPPTDSGHSLLRKGEDGRRFLFGDFGEVNASAPPRPDLPPFQTTHEHRRFAEFADARGLVLRAYGNDGVRATIAEEEANDRLLAIAQEWRGA